MKKILLALSMFAGTLGVFAQNETVPSAVAPDPNAPEMKFEKDAIDYGTIKQDADGTRKFVFTNTGKTPLIISEAHGSCGCTVPNYSKEPVMPGQKSEVSVHYDTHRVGPFSKTVTINHNGKNSPTVIRISGTVEAPTTTTEPTSIIPTPAPAPVSTPIVKTDSKTTATTAKTTAKTTTKTPVKTTTKSTVKSTGTKTSTKTPTKTTTKTTVKKATTTNDKK